jgi:toxin ParE1/3/4
MPADRRLVLTAEAEDDLAAIWRYPAATWDETRADDYLVRIRARFADLVTFPQLGPPRDGLEAGLRHLIVGQHPIYDRIGDDEILVRRILHQSRDALAALVV